MSTDQMPELNESVAVPVSYGLIKEKVIYAGRKGKTKEQVAEILNMEIQYLLGQNPGYVFNKIISNKKNSDYSRTYAIGFVTVEWAKENLKGKTE